MAAKKAQNTFTIAFNFKGQVAVDFTADSFESALEAARTTEFKEIFPSIEGDLWDWDTLEVTSVTKV